MSKRKGVFTKEQEKFLAELADEFFKPDSTVLEMADGAVFRIFISVIDNSFLDKLPEDYQLPLQLIVDKAIAGQWDEVAFEIADIVAEEVDIPYVDEESELLLFKSVFDFITGLLLRKSKIQRGLL